MAAAALGAAPLDCTGLRQHGNPGVPVRLERISRGAHLAEPQRSAHIAGGDGPNCGIIHLFRPPYGTYAAATVLGAIPLLVLVLVFQRQIVSGLTNGAIKG